MAAVFETKPPAVPSAGDDAIVDEAVAERSALVRATIVDRAIGPLGQKHRDHSAGDFESAAFALGDFADAGDGGEVFRIDGQRAETSEDALCATLAVLGLSTGKPARAVSPSCDFHSATP